MLDGALAEARALPVHCIVASDALVSKDPSIQPVAAALVYVPGCVSPCQITLAAGQCTALEVECFATQLGIQAATDAACWHLVVFSDSGSMVDSMFDPKPCSGQVFYCHLLTADFCVEKDWSLLSKDAEYMGNQFFELEGPKGKPLALSSHKGGPWL